MLIQITQRLAIPFILLVLATCYFMEVRAGNAQDLMLIKPVFYLMVVLFFINALTDILAVLKTKQEVEAKKDSEAGELKKTLSFCLLAIALLAIMPYAGFFLSSLAFLYAALLFFKIENTTVLYLLPVGVAISLFVLFDKVFSVPLPKGLLGF